jgi:hypothetical protein
MMKQKGGLPVSRCKLQSIALPGYHDGRGFKPRLEHNFQSDNCVLTAKEWVDSGIPSGTSELADDATAQYASLSLSGQRRERDRERVIE